MLSLEISGVKRQQRDLREGQGKASEQSNKSPGGRRGEKNNGKLPSNLSIKNDR